MRFTSRGHRLIYSHIQSARVLMGALYVTAGILHFVATRHYMAIMPSYLPAQRTLVLISGVAEIVGGLGILYPNSGIQRAAAWGIIVLLIAVMPANIYMVTDHQHFTSIPLWAVWVRLPLQMPLIYWAWLYTRET